MDDHIRMYYYFTAQVVDWNAMQAEVMKEEKEEELDGDAGTQRLFRTIYAGARACPSGSTPLQVPDHRTCFHQL